MKDNSCMITMQEVKDGVRITASRLPKPGRYDIQKFFLCIPESGYCELVDKVTETAINVTDYHIDSEDGFTVADDFDITGTDNGGSRIEFLHHGIPVGYVEAEKYRMRVRY
ncbi:MAG: hypothetical protein HUJ76_09740 [Parasporobacterium sp.]|nr:hypothetical protein [Parasporobacterium sp.]